MIRTTATNRRHGISLIEVLVAIFVMGIGLMALLTLFPLGALEMAQAIKDDRCGHAKHNAAALIRSIWKTAVETNPSDPDYGSLPPGLITQNMLYPNPGVVPCRTDNGLITGNLLDDPSYPVYIDPFGQKKFPPPWYSWLAGFQPQAGARGWIARCQLNSLAGLPNNQLLSLFSSQDDLNLGDLGVPQNQPGVAGLPQREQRYSWAYLVRRSSSNVPTILDLTVVVYSGRSLQFTADLVPAGETLYDADFTAGETVATISWPAAQEPPAIRPGQWIMDVTMVDPNPLPPATSTTFVPQGYFYRVVSVTPTSATSMDVELQTPARATTHHLKPNPPLPFGVAAVVDRVIEVFEMPSLVP
jgi:prepilin-type N-terminal cleavage/methylation domain-containing protein